MFVAAELLAYISLPQRAEPPSTPATAADDITITMSSLTYAYGDIDHNEITRDADIWCCSVATRASAVRESFARHKYICLVRKDSKLRHDVCSVQLRWYILGVYQTVLHI